MIFLTSTLNASRKDAKGKRHAHVIPDTNLMWTNVQKRLPGMKNLVFVANNPADFAINTEWASILFASLELTGFDFKSKTILDNRNIGQAAELVKNAGLIILSGGRVLCQAKFFKQIRLLELLEETKAVVIGSSAGAMNLAKDVCDFEEHASNITAMRWSKGLGIVDSVIFIPHFDGENMIYQQDTGGFDVIGHLLPLSKDKTLHGFPNGSYAIFENNILSFRGDYYIIENGKVSKGVRP